MSTDGLTPHDQVDGLLVGCLEGSATEWATHLEEVCSEQPELAVELRRRFEKLIQLGIIEALGARETELTPERLGHFRLLRRIGGGGMGVVYEAQDEKLGRRVAVKVVRGEQHYFAGSRERFAREMHAVGRLDHPHLCPIYEAGEIDGVQYIAMRYVEGQSLAALLEERRSERAASPTSSQRSSGRTRFDFVLLIEKIARALHAAHEAGIVHRDVKPANILIDGGDGEPVLVDFGLARDTDASQMGLTHTGDRLGTPAYMAPEQVSGEGAIDRRTDVYGLGVTLYECLTLHRPFESTAREDLYRRILSEPPREARTHERSIGSELSVVIGKALEKDPRNRFATAEDFADELRRIRAHEPIQSRRPSVLLRTVRWTQRNRAAAGILVATVVGLAMSLWFLRQSTLSETRFRALAWLQAASSVEGENPELAFKCAREALRMHDDPVIVARIQEIMFQMREQTVLMREPAMLRYTVFSPDGRFLAITGDQGLAALYRRHDDEWRRLQLPDTGQLRLDAPPAFSADSRELAIITTDSRVLRYDLQGAEPTALAVLHREQGDGWCRYVCYPPYAWDDRILVSNGGLARVWNRDGEKLMDLPCSPGSGDWFTAAFLPDDRIVAVGRIWSGDGRELAALPRINPSAWSIAVAKDRFFLAYGDSDGSVHAFDFDGKPLGSTRAISEEHHTQHNINAELDGTGERLLVKFGSTRIRLFDALTLEFLQEWRTESMVSARFSPDGKRIASGTSSGIGIWNLEGVQLDVLRGHEGKVVSLDWSPDGMELASAGAGGSARVWNLDVPRGIPAHVGHGRSDVAVSPSGAAVVFTSETEGALILCDARGKRLKQRPVDLVPRRHHVGFLRDGETVAVYNELSTNISLWNVLQSPEGDRPFQELKLPFRLRGNPPELLPDGRWLLQRESWPIITWDGSASIRIDSPGDAVVSFTVSADGMRVLCGGWTGVVIRSTVDGAELWRPNEPLTAWFVSFSRDGRHVLAAGNNNEAYLWTPPEREATVLRGHQDRLTCAVFSRDGTRIATSAMNGSIRIWDRESLQTILRLSGKGVERIAFTKTGQLVSAGTDGTVRWWWLDFEPLRQAVEQLDVGELTQTERERVAHLLDD